MKDALAIHRMLLERETLHEIVRLPRAIAHADELPEVLGLPPGRCLATRVYAFSITSSVHRFLVAVVVEAGFVPCHESVERALGAHSVRPAPADLVNGETEYAADLVAPLLLPESVKILIDQRIVDVVPEDGVAYTATGEPCTALGIRALDLFTLSGAEPVDLGKVDEVGLTGVIPALRSSP
ncbi:aminoacyl-tRNA deacylase [Actinomadura scrupuli]|uniref:aminoacyl-tRNA deacylase n=1 Tax=Actinomadura scrupuli TaxID=559629 RepID=UPI003D95FE9A